jgi:hypothetical protein
MMGDLVATTEVSYSKGIESIVFHQLIFQSKFIGTDLDKKYEANNRDEQFKTRGLGAVWPFRPVPCRHPDASLGSCQLLNDHFVFRGMKFPD